jgi:hypothetical protein
MPTLKARVNMRIDQDTYDAYTKVADFFNRSTADLMREALVESVGVMHALGAIVDQARAGDTEAMQKLFDAFFQQQRGALDLAQLTTEATITEALTVGKEGGQD